MKHQVGILMCFACKLAACLIAATLALAVVPSVRAAESNSAVLVLDASRSMLAKLGNSRRGAVAGDALAEALTRHHGRFNLGLVVFGGRAQNACNAVATLNPVDNLNTGRFGKAVAALRPVGPAPIGLALRTAAELAARNSPRVNDIVLLSAAADDCKVNTCEMATAIKRALPQMRIHVVAFGKLSKGRLASLRCIAANSNGAFFESRTAAELKNTVNQVFDQLARQQHVPAVATAQPDAGWQTEQPQSGWSSETEQVATVPAARTQQAEPDTPQTIQSLGRKGTGTPVRLTALMIENGPRIPTGLIWRIYSGTRNKSGKYNLLSTLKSARPTIELPPGDYLINVSYGRAHLTKRVTVKKTPPHEEIFVLNAGGLKLTAVHTSGRPLPPNTTFYQVLTEERDQFGKRRVVVANARPGVTLRLNSGIYHIISTYGDANARVGADVTVEASKVTNATVLHQAGKVTLKLVESAGGEALTGTIWIIRDSAGQVIKQSVGALPSHILAAGRYDVTAQYRGKTYASKMLLSPDETRQLEVLAK